MKLEYNLDPKELPLSTLAYIGDAVYELHVRLWLTKKHLAKSGVLHGMSVKLVKASFQAQSANTLIPMLTDEEVSVLKRGRNSNPGTMSKHANIVDYRWATGFESLIGYLFLTEQHTRIEILLDQILTQELDDKLILGES